MNMKHQPMAYFWVQLRAVASYFARSDLYICAISGTRGSSGFGSVSNEQIESSTWFGQNLLSLVKYKKREISHSYISDVEAKISYSYKRSHSYKNIRVIHITSLANYSCGGKKLIQEIKLIQKLLILKWRFPKLLLLVSDLNPASRY